MSSGRRSDPPVANHATVLNVSILSKSANGLVTGVALCDRCRLAGPFDGCCGDNAGLLSIGCEARITSQEVLDIAEREASRATDGEIAFDSGDHPITSGHGWAACLSKAISTLA